MPNATIVHKKIEGTERVNRRQKCKRVNLPLCVIKKPAIKTYGVAKIKLHTFFTKALHGG